MALVGIDVGEDYLAFAWAHGCVRTEAEPSPFETRYALARDWIHNTLSLASGEDLEVAASVPDVLTDEERVAHRDAILGAGMSFSCLRNRSLAACLGVGLVYEGIPWAGHGELSEEPFERLILDVWEGHMRLSWMSSRYGIGEVVSYADMPASPSLVPALLEVLSEEAQGRVVPHTPVIVAGGGAEVGAILEAARGFCGAQLDDRVPPDTVVAKGMWEVARMRAQPMVLR